MKQKISELIIGDVLRYTVQTKKHWWSRWHFIMDGTFPRLFKADELVKFGFVKSVPVEKVENRLKIHTFSKEQIDRLINIQKQDS